METHSGIYSFVDRIGCLGAKLVVAVTSNDPSGLWIGNKTSVT
jgi:hypothetical protein